MASGFAEVIEDDLDLAGGEDLLVTVVVGGAEGGHERRVDAQPFHQALDGGVRGDIGSVGHGQLAFAHGAGAQGGKVVFLHCRCRELTFGVLVVCLRNLNRSEIST